MTNTEEEEELKKIYESNNSNSKEIDIKVRTAMLEIIKLDDPNDGFNVFKHILENFTKEEMAHLTCLYIGSHMIKMMESNPEFKTLCSMLKMVDKVDKKNNFNI